MEEMGMTDKQFNAFLRFVIGDLKDVKKVLDGNEKAEVELDKIIEKLQDILED